MARPRTTVFGEDAHPDLDTEAAAPWHSSARNRAFVDGNEHVAWLSAGAFYRLDGLELDAPAHPAYDLVVAVVTGDLDAPGRARPSCRRRPSRRRR